MRELCLPWPVIDDEPPETMAAGFNEDLSREYQAVIAYVQYCILAAATTRRLTAMPCAATILKGMR